MNRNPNRAGIMGNIHELLIITDVERRLMRAFKTLRSLPSGGRGPAPSWPEVLQTHEEAYGYTEVKMPRFRPTPFDVGDMLTALDWVRGLSKGDCRLLEWRSFDVSFRQIGHRLGKSDETARRRYRDVMIQVWHSANKDQIPMVPKNVNKTRNLQRVVNRAVNAALNMVGSGK